MIFLLGVLAALLVVAFVQSLPRRPRRGDFGSGVLPQMFDRDGSSASACGRGTDPRCPAGPRQTAFSERCQEPGAGSAYGHPSAPSFSRPVDRSSLNLTSPANHPQAGEVDDK